MLESRGAGDSFGRSAALTEGHRWAVLGVALITVIASAVIGNILVEVFVAVLPDFVGVWLGSLVAHCVTTPFLALPWTIMYFELRGAAERPRPRRLPQPPDMSELDPETQDRIDSPTSDKASARRG